MKTCVINQEPDQCDYTNENEGENNCQRPENPGPALSFSDVLYGIVQRESGCDCANRSKKEGRHKSIAVTSTLAAMLETIERRQQDGQEIKDCNEIRNCEAYSA